MSVASVVVTSTCPSQVWLMWDLGPRPALGTRCCPHAAGGAQVPRVLGRTAGRRLRPHIHPEPETLGLPTRASARIYGPQNRGGGARPAATPEVPGGREAGRARLASRDPGARPTLMEMDGDALCASRDIKLRGEGGELPASQGSVRPASMRTSASCLGPGSGLSAARKLRPIQTLTRLRGTAGEDSQKRR